MPLSSPGALMPHAHPCEGAERSPPPCQRGVLLEATADRAIEPVALIGTSGGAARVS
jgi:hypothetical protein